ncbi:MAG: hypothetical protein NZ879_05740 [Archaeoglobaceae archaeon]|nr:hypothetical protein [Archaeoglobaceae archaeon]MDW8118469.1 hypothetical protein [Archaeoglobaceae archaeon]
MERLFIELAGVIDEVETAFGDFEVKGFSRVLLEWIKAKVSRELDRSVEESEIILALLVLAVKRNMAEVEENFYSELKDLFEVLKKIDVFRF